MKRVRKAQKHRAGLRRGRGGWLLAAGCLVMAWGTAGAVETREFVTSEEAEFLQGTLAGLGIAPDGYLVLAPAKERLGEDLDTYVWKLGADGKGRIYAATGSDGRLFVLDRTGKMLHEIESHEYELFAITLDAKGRAVFAGAPNGTIQRWDEGSRTAETLFDVPEGVVWSLVTGPDGTIYAATGERGRIYAVEPGKEARIVYEAPEAHIVSMAWGADGRLLVGTDSQGLFIAVSPRSGEAEVLFDAPQEEIAEILVLEDGTALFAANGSISAPNKDGKGSEEDLTLKIRPVPEGPALYRRDSHGLVTDLWRCPEEDILSLAPAGDGSVWVGTGSKGTLFRVYPDGTSEMVSRFDEGQILSLVTVEGELIVGTGNGGALYRMASRGPVKGTYTSQVLDAGATSRWGVPRLVTGLLAGAETTLQTRSGATRDAGEGWSEWAPVDLKGAGEVPSPPNRYLQWRIEISSTTAAGKAGPRIYEVRIPYLRPNRPPRLREVIISSHQPQWTSQRSGRGATISQTLPSGVQVDYTFPESANRAAAPGEEKISGPWARVFRSAVWEAEDPDGDELIFEISFRGIADEEWTVLEKDVEQPAYTWDASAWPDGRYLLRVRASDRPGNPGSWSLETEAQSQPFEVDNTPPQLHEMSARRVDVEGRAAVLVRGRAVDSASRIALLEVSFDGKGWRRLAPADGILDGLEERFADQVELGDSPPPRFIAVRARDAAGNPAVSRVAALP